MVEVLLDLLVNCLEVPSSLRFDYSGCLLISYVGQSYVGTLKAWVVWRSMSTLKI